MTMNNTPELDEILDTIRIDIKFAVNQLPKFEMNTAEAKAKLQKLIVEARLDEIERLDKQFPDLWKRKKAEYTEADLWKLAHYVANRPDAIKALAQEEDK
jgi:hypothetical protein